MTSEAEGGRIATLAMGSTHGRPPRGFTLLECMVSLLIASLGALAVTRLQIRLRSDSDAARLQLEASHLAQQKLEELRAQPFPLLAPGADQALIASNTTYARWWSSEPDPGGAPFHRVTVNLSWNDRAERLETLRLTTVIAQKDPADLARLSLSAATPDHSTRSESRHADVPLLAVNRGDGTSVLTSAQGVFVYDNLTGMLLSRCTLPTLNAASSPPGTMCADTAPAQPAAPASAPA